MKKHSDFNLKIDQNVIAFNYGIYLKIGAKSKGQVKQRNYSKAYSLSHTPICLILRGDAHNLAPLIYCEALNYVKENITLKRKFISSFLLETV